jgi:uncharacterized tellurite resistance protein B-like protein
MPFAESPLEVDMAALTMREAAVTILMSAVASDGALAQQEADRLDALLPSMRLFQRTSPEHLRDLTETALGLLGSHRPEILLPACAELIPEDLRAPLFALAVELVIADGEVADGETQFVDALKKALAIDDAVAATVIEVLVMKSRV